MLTIAALLPTSTATAARLCQNTYGGDVIFARGKLKCPKAREVVRAWAVAYRKDGETDRAVLRFACTGFNSEVEGLTITCRKGSRRSVTFYANVPT